MTAAVTRITENFSTDINNQTPPPRIYHYTDSNGLFGILKEGNLRLHDVFDMNDPSELVHGLKTFHDVVTARGGADRFQAFYTHHLQPMLNGLIENAEIHEVAYFYTCSFSQNKDDVGQWRAYADDGRGFTLGFNTAKLERHFALGKAGCQTFPVHYDTEQLRVLYGDVMREAERHLLPPGRETANYIQWMRLEIFNTIIHLALYFKHKAYKPEQEYRFLQMQQAGPRATDVKTRNRKYAFAYYREVSWRDVPLGALEEIVIGPAGGETARHFAEECLRRYHGGAPVDITPSEIPYRGR
jgi:hypothetical protein